MELLIIISGFFITAISTVVGFGSGLILLGISLFLFPIKEAIPFITIYYLFNNINKLVHFRKHIDFKISHNFLVLSIPGVIIGSMLMPYLPGNLLKKLLAIVILVLLLLRFTKVKIRTKVFSVQYKIGTFFYGLFSGLISTGSVIKALLFSDIGLFKEKFVATMAYTALFMNLIKIIIYSQYELLTVDEVPILIGLFLASYLGVFIGKKILSRIDKNIFEVIVYIMLILSAIKMMF